MSTLARSVGASTKVGSTTRVPAPAGVPGDSVVLVGLGASDDERTDEVLRRAAGAAARACRGLGSALVLLDAERAEAVALGAGLGSFTPAKVTAKDEKEEKNGDGSAAADSCACWSASPARTR